MGSGKQAQIRRLVPIATLLLVLVLGFFAFRGGIGLSPSGMVSLMNASVTGTFDIHDREFSLGAENTIVRFSAPTAGRVMTSAGEINVSGTFWVDGFDGTIDWDTEQFTLQGSMASLHGTGLDITFSGREKATIILPTGSIEAATVNLSSVRETLTGNLRLEDRWTVRLNETPVAISEFEGSAHLQRINNDTTLSLYGRAEEVRVNQENLLKNIV